MVIHRVRVRYSEAGASSFNTWLDTWLTNMSPWSERENTVPLLRDASSVNTAYYGGDLTFSWSEDAAIIKDQLSGYMSAYCDWSILGYHVCTHDESTPQPCGWDDVVRDGAVPAEVSL
jgi:hypothetical protein